MAFEKDHRVQPGLPSGINSSLVLRPLAADFLRTPRSNSSVMSRKAVS